MSWDMVRIKFLDRIVVAGSTKYVGTRLTKQNQDVHFCGAAA